MFCNRKFGSNLEKRVGLSTKDLTEILNAKTSDKVNIVIETGGTPDWKDKYNIPDDKLQRYIVKDHKLELVESLPNASMGDEKTFEDFLTWGVENYPAEHMGVITFGHGRGSFSGICFDPNYDDDKVDYELSNFTSGNWQSSEYYFEDTIDYTNNIIVGYSDWNKGVKNSSFFSSVQFDDIWAEQYNKPVMTQLLEQTNLGNNN